MQKEKQILILVANEYEDLELHYPKYRLLEAGFKVVVAGQKEKETYLGKHGYPCQADAAFDSIQVADFDALVIPGGYAPDKLRTVSKVIEMTKQFHHEKKLIAFICHAGWIPISAQIIQGVRSTSYQAIKDDMINAGADWVDEAVVKDQHFISSRSPADLPVFCPAMIDYLNNHPFRS